MNWWNISIFIGSEPKLGVCNDYSLPLLSLYWWKAKATTKINCFYPFQRKLFYFSRKRGFSSLSLIAHQIIWMPKPEKVEKEMADHSNILAWEIPLTEESMGSQSWTWLSDTTTITIWERVMEREWTRVLNTCCYLA